jgi:hypothetical protein
MADKKNWEKIAAFAFGVVFIVVMIYIALYVPNPTPTQWFVFRVVLALAAAGVGALLPGLLRVEAPPYVRAGGALALFVVVYWFNPPKLVAPPPEPPHVQVPFLGKQLHVDASVSASGLMVERKVVPHPLSKEADHSFYIDSESGNVNSHYDVCPLAESGWEIDTDPTDGFANGMTEISHVQKGGDKYWSVSPLAGGCIRIYCDGRDGSSHVKIAQVFMRERRSVATQECHSALTGSADARPGDLKQVQLDFAGAKGGCIAPVYRVRIEVRDEKGKVLITKDLSVDRREEAFNGILSFVVNSSGLLDVEYRVQSARTLEPQN